MRFPILVCASLAAIVPASAGPSTEIAVSRNPIKVGESVTLKWLFTGTKVTVKGGSFTTPKVVTGAKQISDKPVKSTRYTFDVTYMAKKEGSELAVPTTASYFVDVDVLNPKALGLVPYGGVQGWKVDYLKGWKYDKAVVSSSTIVYFQKEDDSVERMAVSSMPLKEGAAPLAERVKKDLYNGYEQLEILSDDEIIFCGMPANIITFAGNPMSHPGTRTQSIVLVLDCGSKGFVISGRTFASKFNARKPLLESMVKSFTLTNGTETASK